MDYKISLRNMSYDAGIKRTGNMYEDKVTAEQQIYRVLWQKRPDGGAKLLRMYGTNPQVFVPEQIQGHPCVEIAPYCFAETAHLPKADTIEETRAGDAVSDSALQELCKDAIQEIYLPDTVQKIGTCAFYNCKKLKRLHLGAAAEEIGSDVFMNTLAFRQIFLHASAAEQSGIRKMLSQITSDIEVWFWTDTGIEAVLLYPEYDESYDEIAPAHLFGRKIRGEGFRARQCFRDGKVDFAGYDAVFAQACVEEPEKTLSAMAQYRLQYPFSLNSRHRETYRTYLNAHIEGTIKRLIRQKNLETLLFLCREGLVRSRDLAAGIQAAVQEDWPEGAASLLQYQAAFLQKEKKERYQF